MRKMKKFLSAALAALLLVGALAGCSGSSAGENGELVLYTWENMFPPGGAGRLYRGDRHPGDLLQL